jgi:hypothetical protein
MRIARIAFPVWCVYRGGHRTLGEHGRNLWIAGGRIGIGLDRLRSSISLGEVTRVEVADRAVNDATPGVPPFSRNPPGRSFTADETRELTDVTVHTADGQRASWVVHHRDATWVRGRLAPALEEAGVVLD